MTITSDGDGINDVENQILQHRQEAEDIFTTFKTRIELQNAISDSKYSKGVRSIFLEIFQTDPRVKQLPEGL